MKSDQEKYYFQDYTRLQHQCKAKTKPELPETSMEAVTQIRKITSKNCFVSGMTGIARSNTIRERQEAITT